MKTVTLPLDEYADLISIKDELKEERKNKAIEFVTYEHNNSFNFLGHDSIRIPTSSFTFDGKKGQLVKLTASMNEQVEQLKNKYESILGKETQKYLKWVKLVSNRIDDYNKLNWFQRIFFKPSLFAEEY